MPPTLKRILWNGIPAAAVLALVGYLLAETADLFLDNNRPQRAEVEQVGGVEPLADPIPPALRRTLPLTLAAWGFGLVAAGEGLRRMLKGPAKKPATKLPPVPKQAEVDKLLDDLMKSVSTERPGPEVTTPAPAAVQVQPQ